MSVSQLDMSELVCPMCGKALEPDPVMLAYTCEADNWRITRIEFLRNSHGPATARKARIANKEVGAPIR